MCGMERGGRDGACEIWGMVGRWDGWQGVKEVSQVRVTRWDWTGSKG